MNQRYFSMTDRPGTISIRYHGAQRVQHHSLKGRGLSVYTIKPELYEVGLTTGQTPFGHTVPVYDMERTICDLLRSRSSMEIQTFQGALKDVCQKKGQGSADFDAVCRYVPG